MCARLLQQWVIFSQIVLPLARPALVVTALGADSGLDAEGIARVIGHVWSSSLARWVSGMAPDGSVQAELTHAARLLVGVPARV